MVIIFYIFVERLWKGLKQEFIYIREFKNTRKLREGLYLAASKKSTTSTFFNVAAQLLSKYNQSILFPVAHK